MSYSTDIARLTNQHRHLRPDEVIRLMDGDASMKAKMRREDDARQREANNAAAAQWLRDNVQKEINTTLFLWVPAHAIWLFFVPKPPWTHAFLKAVFGLDVY